MTVHCCWNICSATATMLQTTSSSCSDYNSMSLHQYDLPFRKKPSSGRASASNHGRFSSCLNVGFHEMAEIAQNKVLIAAGVSAAIGQLSKPFTSTILYQKGFDFRAAVQPGGFPSTHSAAVVATATTVALERGFSDSIFGLAVVYASLVMYDAQGVRREVGKHAKVINKALHGTRLNCGSVDSDYDCDHESGTSVLGRTGEVLCERTGMESLESKISSNMVLISIPSSSGHIEEEEEEEEEGEGDIDRLKEVVGHTEVEVTAGAFLGFFIALVVNAAST